MPEQTIAKNHAPNTLDVALGLRVRERRRALRISQTALAKAVGLTFQQIQKYERGRNRISFSRLVEIAHALDCRTLDLIGDLDDGCLPSLVFRQDTSYLRHPGAPDLLKAYSAISGPLQRAVLKLVTAMAADRAKETRVVLLDS